MPHLFDDTLEFKLQGLDSDLPDYAPQCVEAILAAAREAGATDVHLQPTGAALELKFRVDGVLCRDSDREVGWNSLMKEEVPV